MIKRVLRTRIPNSLIFRFTFKAAASRTNRKSEGRADEGRKRKNSHGKHNHGANNFDYTKMFGDSITVSVSVLNRGDARRRRYIVRIIQFL